MNERLTSTGYLDVKIPKDHPFASMGTKHGYVRVHRLVMAQHLGYPLAKDIHVHHVNGNKLDNRIENLEIVTNSQHMRLHKAPNNCCPRGHEFTPANTRIRKNGTRQCRKCDSRRSVAFKKRKRARERG